MKYEPRLHVVLHQPEIPYNTGSVGRTCVAAGAKLWLIRPLGFRLDDYYLRRAGLDYWEHLVWEAVDSWEDFLLKQPDGNRWYFTKTAGRSYLTAGYAPGDVLIFGCETQGLPASLLQREPEQNVRIPIRPEARSLNLSNSVSIAVFETLRQWGGDA